MRHLFLRPPQLTVDRESGRSEPARRYIDAATIAIGAGLALSATAALVCFASSAQAISLEDAYGDAFVNYLPYVRPVPPQRASEPATASLAPARPTQAASAPKPGPSKVDVAWLRQAYPLLQERAINDPTPTNVAAELYLQRVIVDKSQRYAEARMRVVNADPLLNENNRVPTASLGATTVANANRDAQAQAVRELARTGGLLVFVDGRCRFCAMQLPILELLKRDYGMDSLVLTLDGQAPKVADGRSFSGAVMTDNGMFRKLQLVLTPSIVYVPRPTPISGAGDRNRYLVVAQGFYVESDLVKQIAFAGYDSQLLSSDVAAGLAVWDRGVASTRDLGGLALDVNDPVGIQRSLQGVLARRYTLPGHQPQPTDHRN